MIQFDFGVLIDRSPGDVFKYVTDLSNLPKWQTIIHEIKPADLKPMGVGATFSLTVEILGRKQEGLMMVTHYEPDSLFGYETKAGPSSVKAQITFKQVGTGTRLAISAQAEPAGVLKLAEGAIQSQMKTQMQNNLNRLKSILESGV